MFYRIPRDSGVLVEAEQYALAEHMAVHRAFQRGLVRCAEIRQHHVQRIQLEEVAMAADRRAGAAVAGALPVVDAVARAARQRCALTPCGRPAAVGGRLYSTQCTQVVCGAAGSGASGSSTISARLLVAGGRPDHASGGDRSLPSQVWSAGMPAPSAKALEIRCSDIAMDSFVVQTSAAASSSAPSALICAIAAGPAPGCRSTSQPCICGAELRCIHGLVAAGRRSTAVDKIIVHARIVRALPALRFDPGTRPICHRARAGSLIRRKHRTGSAHKLGNYSPDACRSRCDPITTARC